MPTIKSSTELRNSYNSISTLCHERRQPVFITKNGQGDLAVMSIEVYEELTKNQVTGSERSINELYNLLDEGRADVIAERTRPHNKVMADLRRRIIDGSL